MSEIEFRHVRPSRGHGSDCNKSGMTLAFKSHAPLYNLKDTDEVVIGIAVCSRNDNFCYRTGRAIATGRMSSHGHVVTAAEVRTLLSGSPEPLIAAAQRATAARVMEPTSGRTITADIFSAAVEQATYTKRAVEQAMAILSDKKEQVRACL